MDYNPEDYNEEAMKKKMDATRDWLVEALYQTWLSIYEIVSLKAEAGKGLGCYSSRLSSPVPATHLKVLIDNILMPDEPTVKANRFTETFKDVGIGGYVVHPKRSISYN